MGVVGFQFFVRDGGGGRWVSLRGQGGGCIGNGSLHIRDWGNGVMGRVCARLLAIARGELGRTGVVYEHVSNGDGPFTSRAIRPSSIESCRATKLTMEATQ